MKKKVKKIPKYNAGGITAGYLAKNNMPKLDVNFNSNPGTTGANFKMDNSDGYDWNGAMDAMVAASQIGAQTLGIEQGKNAAIFNTIGTAAEMIPGVGKYVSAGLKTIGALAGEGGHVDQNTGEYTKSSGLTRLFGWGRSDDSVMKEANRVKGSILAKARTEDLKADWMNQGINPAPNVLAAEGGIMRQPVDALVSKGELIYNPVTKKLSQVPGSKGKPNKADDVYAKLYEGDVVISNSPTMLMTNGKTPAQNLMGMVDKYSTGGTVKAREAIIKKVVNWQEANKTKPQQYAMYDEGTGKVKVRKKEKIPYVVWDGKFGYFDANGGFHDMSDIANQNLPDSAYLGRYEWVDAPIKEGNVGKHTSTELDFNTSRHTRDGVNDKKPEYNWRKSPTQEEIDTFYGHDRKKVSETVVKDRSERINNKNRKYLVENKNENQMAGTLSEVVVTAPRINKSSSKKSDKKSSSSKATLSSTQEKKLTPEQIAESLRIADVGERHWLRGSVTEPKQSFTSLVKIIPEKIKSQGVNNVAPLAGITQLTDTTGTDSTGYTGSNWQDNLYRMALLTQPLWDRAKAEPVKYEIPVDKYIPTGINIDPTLNAIDESMALARYNQQNINPNTGAGMAYGLQAAANRAKQYADAYTYQTNAQNELIGKNIGIYNNWTTNKANIMNKVYDQSATNRATARNINRQNRAAALSNFGTMLSDDKKMAMEKMKFNILKPAIRSTYEDATVNDLMNMYNSLFG